MKITRGELKIKLELHLKWLHGEEGGLRANLSRADLSGANLSLADLSWADLSGANLSRADLSRADLSGANLSGADLDFASWPLWCGSKSVKVDLKLVFQLLAHVSVLTCKDEEFKVIKDLILPYAKKSHRAADLGIETGEVGSGSPPKESRHA